MVSGYGRWFLDPNRDPQKKIKPPNLHELPVEKALQETPEPKLQKPRP